MIENIKEIKSSPITGKEDLKELLEKAFTAHLGRIIKDYTLDYYMTDALGKTKDFYKFLECLNVSYLAELNKTFPQEEFYNAYKILENAIRGDFTIFLTLNGALTPGDFGASCLNPLIERGIFDCIVTTGANVYHQVQRDIGLKFYKYDVEDENLLQIEKDISLAEDEWSRIYNIIFRSEDLTTTDEFLRDKVMPKMQRKITFTEFCRQLGIIIGNKYFKRNSWLTLAAEYNVPVFCGAPYDSSLGFHAVRYALENYGNPLNKYLDFDTRGDVVEMTALQYLAQIEGKIMVSILGGGVPKNFALQAEPILIQGLGVDARGFDSDIQIAMGDVRDGGLTTCPFNEGHTWGKVGIDGMFTSVFINGEIFALFPLFVYLVCKNDLRKNPKNLFLRKEEAVFALKKAYNKSKI